MSESAPNEQANASEHRPPERWRKLVWPIVLIVVGCSLYLPGLRWGLPGIVSWSQDTIAGLRTIGAVRTWDAGWKGWYPPLHYVILTTAYAPVLAKWQQSGECRFPADSPVPDFQPPHAPKISLLVLIARAVSVAMAIAAGLGVYFAARELTGDSLAAGIAGVVLMIGAAFTYFAHLGNVDVPSVCWFAWSALFYARAARGGRWFDCLLLGLFASAAISTKDAVAGVYPGMAVMLVIAEARRADADVPMIRRIITAMLQPKWLIGFAAFALPYLYLNGLFHGMGAYASRMRFWFDGTVDTLQARHHRYSSQPALAWATVLHAAGAVGWPMVAAMTAAVCHAIVKRRWLAAMTIVPAISYYLIVIARIDFVYARYLLPPLALVGILVGVGAADWLRARRVPSVARFGGAVLLAALSLGYAVGIDLEMMHDSRYDAENWFAENVKPPASVGAFLVDENGPLKAQYLPRFLEMGYATYPVAMRYESFERPQPEYLVLTSFDTLNFDEQQRACMADLVEGKLGYRVVATFEAHWLGDDPSWLTIAGFGAPTPGKISPKLTVLDRSASDSP